MQGTTLDRPSQLEPSCLANQVSLGSSSACVLKCARAREELSGRAFAVGVCDEGRGHTLPKLVASTRKFIAVGLEYNLFSHTSKAWGHAPSIQCPEGPPSGLGEFDCDRTGKSLSKTTAGRDHADIAEGPDRVAGVSHVRRLTKSSYRVLEPEQRVNSTCEGGSPSLRATPERTGE